MLDCRHLVELAAKTERKPDTIAEDKGCGQFYSSSIAPHHGAATLPTKSLTVAATVGVGGASSRELAAYAGGVK